MTFLYRKRLELSALFFMCAVYFFSYFQRVGIPGTIFNELQHSFAASAVAVAALASVFLYIYGGMQFLGGILADRYGGARTLLAGGALLSIGSILFPLAASLPFLYGARAVVALGSSLIFISIVKQVDIMFAPRHFAVLLGASVFLGYSGGLAGTWPLDRAVASFGWRAALLTAGVLSALALAATIAILKRSGLMDKCRPTMSALNFACALRNVRSYPIMAAHSCAFSIYFLFQAAVGKKLLMDCCGMEAASASSVTFAMMAVSMAGASLSGLVSRAMGNRRKPLLTGSTALILTATAGTCASLMIHPDPTMIASCMAAISVSAGASTIFIASMKEVNSPDSAATSVGLLNGAVYLLVAVVSHLAGYIMDCFKEQAVHAAAAIVYPVRAYAVILMLCSGMAACAFISSLFIKESRGNQIYGFDKASHAIRR